MKRQKVQAHNYFKLITSSLLIAIIASFLALSLKKTTEFCQEHLFEFAEKNNSYLFIILPTIGITAIYFLAVWCQTAMLYSSLFCWDAFLLRKQRKESCLKTFTLTVRKHNTI